MGSLAQCRTGEQVQIGTFFQTNWRRVAAPPQPSEGTREVADRLIALVNGGLPDFGEPQARVKDIRGRVWRVAVDLADDDFVRRPPRRLEQVGVEERRIAATPQRRRDDHPIDRLRLLKAFNSAILTPDLANVG